MSKAESQRSESVGNIQNNAVVQPGSMGFVLLQNSDNYVQRMDTFAPVTNYRMDMQSPTVSQKVEPVHNAMMQADVQYHEDVTHNLAPLNRNLGKINAAITKGWVPELPNQVENYIALKTPTVTDRSNHQAPRGETIISAQKKSQRGLDDIASQRILQVKSSGQSDARMAETLKHENSHLRDDTSGFDMSQPLHTYASEVNAFRRAAQTQLSPMQTVLGTNFNDVKAHYQQELGVGSEDAQRLENIDRRIQASDL